jgi:hypothetical protein
MLTTPETIRTLQRKLYRKAKQEPAFRFHALYDKRIRWGQDCKVANLALFPYVCKIASLTRPIHPWYRHPRGFE